MKVKIQKTSLLVFMLFIAQLTFGQTMDISGTVKGSDGLPLPGVSVKVVGSNNSTTTDFEGKYTLKAKQGDIIDFSYMGYQSQTVVVGTNTTINVTMEQGQTLDEVVVIGYGTRSRLDNTSAISSVSADQITETKVANPIQAIQGKIAGVQISASDRPGATPSVTIRGLGTVMAGRNPLYVVDGMFTDNINNINPNDIETFQVLKDASALAIYGNRGANGVIIITTKKGKGKISVEYNGYIGVRTPLKTVDMANANEYANYTNIANGANTFSLNQPHSTDWFNEITQTDVYNEHHVRISGSSEKVRYLLSLGNYNEEGLLKGSYYNRSTLRSNNSFNISKNITLSQTIGITYTKQTLKPQSAFTTAYKQSPIVPVRFSDGRYGSPIVNNNGLIDTTGSLFNNVGNPVAQVGLHNEKRRSWRLQGGLELNIDFAPFIEGLKFTSRINAEYYNDKSYNFDNGVRILGTAPASFDNQLTNIRDDYFNWLTSNFFTYNKTFGGIHNIALTLGMEASSESGNNFLRIVRQNVNPNDKYWNLNGTNYVDNITEMNSTNFNAEKTLSYFGRIQYKLDGKYLLSGTLRRDGSSQFSDGNRWGTFGALGLGWIISRENFLKNVDFIDLLKIRGSWGRLGNQNIPLNIPTFSSGGLTYAYSFDGVHVLHGITIDQTINPNLSWEITEEISGGLDFAVLNRRLSGSVDLYKKETKNVILQSTPPSTTGISKPGFDHLGSVTNKGVEVVLGWKDKIGDFSYAVNVNYSYNKNELTSIEENVNPIRGGSLNNGQITKLFSEKAIGQPLGSFYLWEVNGMDSNGNFTYTDIDGDGVTGASDADDRKFFGSYIPKSTYGINITLGYKNFDLSIQGYGTAGAKVYNGKKAQRFSGENIEKSVATNFWTPTNTHAANPAPFNSVPLASTYYLESGDYFRINNIMLGYTLKNPVKFVQSLRLYASAINPFITQKFSGYTPELAADGNPYGTTGIELDAYPALSSYVFGVDINF